MMPKTTSKVPRTISVEVCSPRTKIAMVALNSGLTDCSALLREAPIFSTPV